MAAEAADAADVAGVLLAAGTSSRMRDEFKLLLPYGPGTVVGASARAALEAGLRPLLVVTGHRAGEVRAAVRSEGLPGDVPELAFVSAPRYREGQSASLARGVRALRSAPVEAAAVLLADEPGIRPEAIRRILEAWREDPDSVARARYRDRPGHPVIFPRDRFSDLEGLEGDRGARDYLERHRADVREVRLEGPAPVDVDTREDYEQLVE